MNKLNITLLREIKQKILNVPKQFDMESFYTRETPWENIPNCGTAACIAGWAACLTKKINPKIASFSNEFNVRDVAAQELGLTQKQMNKLFYVEAWPKKFRIPYTKEYYKEDVYKSFIQNKKANPQKLAKIAARRIEHFIKYRK